MKQITQGTRLKVAGPGKVERVRVRAFSAAGATVNAVITGFLENFENAIQKIKKPVNSFLGPILSQNYTILRGR